MEISPITKANATGVLTLKHQIKALTETLNQQMGVLLQQMEEQGLREITIEGVGKVSYRELSEKLIIDSTRLKKVYASVYNDCVKVSTTKAHLNLTLNK